MTHLITAPNAAAAATQYLDTGGRKLAYRVVGDGKPLVLFNRFRGVLDTWDTLFIDSLAAQGFQVVTFDYSGLGMSSGEKSYSPPALVKDARELILGLGLKDVAIGGWSLGGIVAQIYLAMFGADVSHVVLLATTPPGKLVKTAEQLFYDTAAKPGVDLDQFTTVFFEPADEGSRAASRRSLERILSRGGDRSPDVDADWAIAQIGREPRNPAFPAEEVLQMLKHTKTPILHLGADHDIIFPVENWYALNGQLTADAAPRHVSPRRAWSASSVPGSGGGSDRRLRQIDAAELSLATGPQAGGLAPSRGPSFRPGPLTANATGAPCSATTRPAG